jgi:alkylation response protein AidB-like acyl-CoA dehydrogenase
MMHSSQSFSAEDRALLRDAVARFVARACPVPRPATNGPGLWPEIAELGLTGLLVDPDHGGTGGGDEELALVMEMFGHGLVLEPFLGTAVLGATLIAALASKDQQERWLPGLVAGDLRLALAHYDPATGFGREPEGTQAEAHDGATILRGTKSCVLDAPAADLLLVSAREGAGYGLFMVPAHTPGLNVRPWTTVDGRGAADVVLDGVRVNDVDRLGPPAQAGDAIAWALDRATLAVGSDALGSMQSLLAQTRDYLRTRKQFGQALARFQVLQHRVVDMHIAIEESRALLAAGRASLGSGVSVRTAAVAAAKYKVGQSARFVGEQAVQMHGAMGMTNELAVSHHFKRLLSDEALFGDCDFQLARFRAAGGSVPG